MSVRDGFTFLFKDAKKCVLSFFLSIKPRLEKNRNEGNILEGQNLPLRIFLSNRRVAEKRVIKQMQSYLLSPTVTTLNTKRVVSLQKADPRILI